MVGGLELDRGRLAWWALGIALAVSVLYVLHRFIGTFVFGVFLYYATRPIYKRVRTRIEHPGLAAVTALALFLLPTVLLITYTVAIAWAEVQKFAGRAGEFARSDDFAEYETLLEPYLEAIELVTQPDQLLAGGGVDVAGDLLLTTVTYLGTFAIFALHVFVIVAVAFYLLRDDRQFVRWFTARYADDAGVLDQYLTVVDNDFNNIFFGNILNALLTATIAAIVYTLLNFAAPSGLSIPYAALIGLLAGVASLIPVVGMKLVYVPVALYLFALPLLNQEPELMWFPITFAAVSFVVVDTIPDLVLRPYVSGRSLHVGALMLAYVLGPLLFGWYGLFLAPMLLVLIWHFARIVMPELVAGRPMKPYAVDPTYITGSGVADNPTTRQTARTGGSEQPTGAPSGAPPADGGTADPDPASRPDDGSPGDESSGDESPGDESPDVGAGATDASTASSGGVETGDDEAAEADSPESPDDETAPD